MRITLDLFRTRTETRRWKQSCSFGNYVKGPFIEITWYSKKAPFCDLCGECAAVRCYAYDDGGSDTNVCAACDRD